MLVGIIQLWRRVTDSTLIDECTDDIVIDNTTVKGTSGICFERARSRKCISTMLIIKITTVREREKKARCMLQIKAVIVVINQFLIFVST